MIKTSTKAFIGEHCESTASGTLLNHIGIELSEALIFGLGQGLGFIIWDMKCLNLPFIGGRIRPELLTRNLCRNLGLHLDIRETSSARKAWQNVRAEIDRGIPVGLKLDCYHLEYFSNKIHFAAHYVAMTGYDEKYAYLVDTRQQGSQQKVLLENLAAARSEKGPMASKNLSYTIAGEKPQLSTPLICRAISENAADYLNPPIKNIGYKGILKTAQAVPGWLDRVKEPAEELGLMAVFMEKAGTGGALFRNFYRDFLGEACQLTGLDKFAAGHDQFKIIAGKWNQVADCLEQAGRTRNRKYLEQGSLLLQEIALLEKDAMEKLL